MSERVHVRTGRLLLGAATLLALLPAPLHAQGPWRSGARAGVAFRLDGGASAPGVGLRGFVGRTQTPRVEVRAGAGLLWFPGREEPHTFLDPGGVTVTETRSEELVGPYLAVAAARRASAGRARVLLTAEVGAGVLREEVVKTSTRPTISRPFHFADREITPTWTLGVTACLPAWGPLGIRPKGDARISVITLAGDDFIPAVGVGVGWSTGP